MNSNSICREPTGVGNCALNHGHYGPHSCCAVHDRSPDRQGAPMPADYWTTVEANRRSSE